MKVLPSHLLLLAVVPISSFQTSYIVTTTRQATIAFRRAHSHSSSTASTNTLLYNTTNNNASESKLPIGGIEQKRTNMNAYNVPLEVAVDQWTAVVQAKSQFLDEGIYLQVQDSSQYFVDTLTFDLSRVGGMGIELLELAGGRDDGVGITICSGLVEGGNAEGSGIEPGDSIVKLEVVNDDPERSAVSSECLNYDETISRIMSLPDLDDNNGQLRVTVKRIRRKPKVTVKLQYPPSQKEDDVVLELFAGENLRRAMLTRGVKLNDALSRRFDSGGTGDCGAEGTCATCVVSIDQGGHLVSPQGIQESQMLVKNPRWRLACKTVIGYGAQEGTMTIRVNPRQWV